jgi:diaminopimelate epimerase
VELVKAHAYGNDFLLVSGADFDPSVDAPDRIARTLCHRHTGFGADGLLVVEEHQEGMRMRLWNADGSPSELSGNGLRCVAASVAARRGLSAGAVVTITTDAGAKPLTLVARDRMRFTFDAEMGPPEDIREERIDVGSTPVVAVTMRVGNPQCVVLGPATEERLQTLAARLCIHPRFPEGTNVELAEVLAADRVRILIWERGVGPTASSGTGTCAAAVAAAAYGGAGRRVEVESPGGTQVVDWSSGSLRLTGWAELVGRVHWWR